MTAPSPVFSSDNPIVQKIASGTAAENIRLAAARGALPVAPEELLYILYLLRSDTNVDVVGAIATTLAELDEKQLTTGLESNKLSSDMLDFLAHEVSGRERAVQSIVRNRSTADRTLVFLAKIASGTPLELLVTNQVALIRTPELIDALLANSKLTPDQARRLAEVREEFFLKRERENQRRADEEARLAALRAKATWTTAELEKLQEDLAKEVQAEREAAAETGEASEPTPSEEDAATTSAGQRIMQMSVPEKVLTAIRGNRTERFILIRDANRLVATSVIKSPKVSDSEVEQYAGMRNILDEILRFIGHKRDWMRNYTTMHTLIKNPRTPIAVSLNLLPRLQLRDLKHLVGDRNVAEVLRRQAKLVLQKTGKN